MNRLDFCIIGAPKCGTTAVFEALRRHPDVFLPEVKEPHYFCLDFPTYRRVHSVSEYEALFRPAGENQVCGEASVFYLLSNCAVPELMKFAPNAKVVAMVRDPIAMASSLHSQLLFSQRENVPDFEAAWRLQEARAAGSAIPPHCSTPEHLQYRTVCSLGKQLERLFENVPRSQAKIVLFEDFVENPGKVCRSLLDFLEVPSDGFEVDPRPVNASKVHRSRSVSEFVMYPPFPLNYVKAGLRSVIGPPTLRARRSLYGALSTPRKRPPLRSEFRSELVETFADDVRRIEHIVERPLAHWLR